MGKKINVNPSEIAVGGAEPVPLAGLAADARQDCIARMAQRAAAALSGHFWENPDLLRAAVGEREDL